ncbi:expressed unknown protein [Seminavis robusta]|uniref:Uncharacterized protein n=1 Tax=Seminavis robusta TaxID=568900 RepID=A0A9N8DWL5_9STRA|nr:expressed unknown protein [Seminavis robusta]|eukprot:Sro420_g139250.1 n/a (236) ;mRNA; f:13305-14012
MTQEDRAAQFMGKDAMGLEETKGKPPPSEDAVREEYFRTFSGMALVIGPFMASTLYFAVTTVFPAEQDMIASKLKLIAQFELQYVYMGYYIIFWTRLYAVINSNAARAPARLGRPNQHVYQIMDASGPYSKAPYVLMVDDKGPIGRFNRAQRACFNLDEQLPLFLAGFLLQSFVFGKLSLIIPIAFFVGGIRFCNLYKVSADTRGGGFIYVIFAYHANAALVLLAVALMYYKKQK